MSLYFSSVTGMRAQQARLDTVANNIANLNTPGFKAVRIDVVDIGQQPFRVARARSEPDQPIEIGSGAALAAASRSFAQGALQFTGNPLDLAILGDDAYFQVALPGGDVAYTRAGALAIDGEGRLTTGAGDLITPPVAIPAGARVTHVRPDGLIVGTLPGDDTPRAFGQITLVRFANPEGLASAGANRWVATVASGDPEEGLPGQGGFPEVASGVLEASNVDLADQATTMIEAQRAYSMNLRALQTLDEMVEQAVHLRR